MGLFEEAVPGGVGKPLAVAIGALLVGKMMGGLGSGRQPAQNASGTPEVQYGHGGSNLSGLLDKIAGAGHEQTVQSWLGNGSNQPIEPQALHSALGQTTVAELAQHAGMSEQQLLSELSRVLPGIIDRLTPNGRVPGDSEVAGMLSNRPRS